MDNTIQKSFGIILKILKFFGIYCHGEKTKLLTLWMYVSYFYYLTFVLLCLIQGIFGNIPDMQKNQIWLASSECVSGSLKIIPFLKNSKRITKCIDYFSDKKFEAEHTYGHMVLDNCVTICRRNIKIYLIVESCVVVFWYSRALFKGYYTLPLDIWLPFEITNFVVYAFVWIYSVLGNKSNLFLIFFFSNLTS